MEERKLSIVIPLYNSKEYFPLCLDSIYSQGIDEDLFEVIVVDDGSNDGAEVIADETAAIHSNMRVIHQANTGAPSIPRNRGLAMAAGAYVFFCDSDDTFLPGSLEKMIQHAEQDSPDIGLFNLDSNGRDVRYNGLFQSEKKHCTVFNSKITDFLGPYKLFSVSFLRSHNLLFPNTYYEDLSFVMEAYLLSENTCVYNDGPYYFVRMRDDESSMTQSGTTSHGANSLEKRLLGLEYLAGTVSKYYSSSECPQIYNRLFERATFLLKSCFRGDNPEQSLDRLRAILAPSFSPEVKDLLDVRSNMTISALLNTAISFSDLKDLVFSWPNGPACDFSVHENSLAFRQYDHGGRVIDTGSIPLESSWTDSPRSRFCIIDNTIKIMQISEGKARFQGCSVLYANTFSRIESVQLAGKSKSSETVSIEAQLGDFNCDIVSESLKLNRYSFEWRVEFDLTSLVLSDVESAKYAFALSVCTDNGIHSFRIGQTADDQVKESFVRSYAFIGNDLYFGSLTKFGNADIAVNKNASRYEASLIAVNATGQNSLSFSVLLMERQGHDNNLPSVGFRNRRSGTIIAASKIDSDDNESLEAAVSFDEAFCHDLLSESQEGDIWDLGLTPASPSDDDCDFEGIGSRRPAGTMALLRQHPIVCDGFSFITYGNKEKNLSVVVQSEFQVLDDAGNTKINAISCGDHKLMLNACLDAKSVAMRPQLELAFCQGEDSLTMQGESYDTLDKRFRHEIRATFNMDDLLSRYDHAAAGAIDDRWSLEAIASLGNRTQAHWIGSKRRKGSFARYQKAAYIRENLALLPFESEEKQLFIRVADVDLLLKNETSLTVSDVSYEAAGIRITGTLKTPLLLCVDSFNCSARGKDIAVPLSVDMDVTAGGHPHASWNVLLPLSGPLRQAASDPKAFITFVCNFDIGDSDYRLPIHADVEGNAINQVNSSLSSVGFPLSLSVRENHIVLQRRGISTLFAGLFGRR